MTDLNPWIFWLAAWLAVGVFVDLAYLVASKVSTLPRGSAWLAVPTIVLWPIGLFVGVVFILATCLKMSKRLEDASKPTRRTIRNT